MGSSVQACVFLCVHRCYYVFMYSMYDSDCFA